MWPTEEDLEPIDSIIDRMNPIPGFPYPMKVARNENFPTNVGNPWIGAYTKNGYWYKMSYGGEEEWKEIVGEMQYRNNFMLDTDSFKSYISLFSEGNENVGEKREKVKLLVVKNINDEVIGTALLIKHENYTMIGAIFILEDYRHVGIGKTMMNEICKLSEGNSEISLNCISYLLPSIKSFGSLEPRFSRKIEKVVIENPFGYDELSDPIESHTVKKSCELVGEDFEAINRLCKEITNEHKNWNAVSKFKKAEIVALFDEDSCLGVCVRREIQNQENNGKGVPDLMIGPLYAESSEVAEILLKQAVTKFYNPEDDYDFDVDIYAIYRRTVSFFVFSESQEFMRPLIQKFAGNDHKITTDRLYFQTCSNSILPAISHSKIFALDDLHIFLT